MTTNRPPAAGTDEDRDGSPATACQFRSGVTALMTESFRIPHPSAAAIAHCLYQRMADASLVYHTPAHVLAIWQFWEEMPAAKRPSLDPVERAAIWFHDAIYVPTAPLGSNERWSAEFTLSLLAAWVSPTDLARLSGLILATSCHDQPSPVGPNGADVILDLDLSNLATPYFPAVSQLIRREYGHLDDNQWQAGRRAFLRRMLDRPAIYRTDVFQRLYEPVARANLLAALAES